MTKNERHTIYVQALIAYRSNYKHIGLCGAIRMALEHLGEYDTKPNPYENMKAYPEIHKHKQNNGFWFPIEDIKTRIKILKQAIEETK